MRKLGILFALFAFLLMQGRATPVLAGNVMTFKAAKGASGPSGMTGIKAYGNITTQRRVIKRKYPAAKLNYPTAKRKYPAAKLNALSGKKIASDEGKSNSSSGGRNYPSNSGKKAPRGRGTNYGDRNRGGSSLGLGLTIDLGTLLQQTQPPPPPPPKVYPKTKKASPKPKRKKKKHTARRKSPRKTLTPPVARTVPQFVPNEILVFVTSDQPEALGDELAAALGLTKVETVRVALLEGSIIRFRYPDNRPLSNVIATLTADPRVSQAQPNNYYQPVGKRKKRSKKSNPQYSLVKLSVSEAHELSKGRDVSIAVIDTGIDARHPSLSNAIAMSYDAVGDGKKAVARHGTAIAGLIAGRGRVKGVAPLSRVLAVRAFYMNRLYNKPLTDGMILLRALDWSFANKARIFNMSFAGPYDPLVKKALENAYNKGVILVAAAGNGGPTAAPAYPAAYPQVIAITAVDNKDKLYAQANRGSYLTVAAPGVDVLVPSLKKGYRYSSGTSLAAAHISGLIALLLESYPQATAEQIVNAIQQSARDLGPKGFDIQYGAGLADAYASLISLSNGQ